MYTRQSEKYKMMSSITYGSECVGIGSISFCMKVHKNIPASTSMQKSFLLDFLLELSSLIYVTYSFFDLTV